MLLVPAAFTATFGRMVGRRRQGWALYAAMLVMFLGGTAVLYAAEAHGSPAQHAAGLHTHVVAGSAGGNMEGKEQRFGTAGSALFVASGTASGDGAVNSGVESYTGLGRRGGDGEHDDRRGDLRRARLRSVRDDLAGRAGRVRRRADGRANTGVPRQADPGPRGQARDDRDAVRAAARAGASPRWRSRHRSGRQSMPRPRTAGVGRVGVRVSVSQAQNNGSAMAGYTRLHPAGCRQPRRRTGSRSRTSRAAW